MEILLVDDDANLLAGLVRSLRGKREGWSVRIASNGAQALELMARSASDVVVTDILMPVMEGLETIASIRENHPQTRIVAMSGGGRTQNLDFLKVARHLGADRTLPKPFSVDELIQAIHEISTESEEEPPLL